MKALFLHSWGSSLRDWNRVAPLLPAELDAALIDLRGFGDAPAPDGSYDVASYVEDVLGMVEGWDEYILVGHSMGGKFALATAARRPTGLRGLFLVAPSPPTPEPMTDETRQANLQGYGSPDFARNTVASITCGQLPDAYREAAEADYLRTSERAWRAWLEEGSQEDLSLSMGNVTVPVQVIVGVEDPVMRPAMLRREVVARLADCNMTEVEGSGHLLPSEKPADLARGIAEFLARLESDKG